MKTPFTEKHLNDLGYFEVNGVFYKGHREQSEVETTTKTARKIKPLKTAKIDLFVVLVKQQLGIDLIQEYRFDKKRKWRFDYCLPEKMIALEVEGGIWTQGRHTRGKGYQSDMEKYSEASVQGWILIRRTPDQLMSEETLRLIREALKV